MGVNQAQEEGDQSCTRTRLESSSVAQQILLVTRMRRGGRLVLNAGLKWNWAGAGAGEKRVAKVMETDHRTNLAHLLIVLYRHSLLMPSNGINLMASLLQTCRVAHSNLPSRCANAATKGPCITMNMFTRGLVQRVSGASATETADGDVGRQHENPEVK